MRGATVERKRFRIEQMLPQAPVAPGAPRREATSPGHAELMAEMKALRAALAARPELPNAEIKELKQELELMYEAITRTKQELAALQGSDIGQTGVARASLELDAVVGSTENATQKILHAAEEIDEIGKTLTASLKRKQDQALAQDIQDQVVRIYEACNFQDLAGQRIGKVTATLKFIEQHILRMMEIWGGLDQAAAAKAADSTKLINGPQLDGADGHASQQDIDLMFN